MVQQRDVDHIVNLAAEDICNGVIEEPRVFYDVITLLANGLPSSGDPNTFINGEQFPIRITQASFALRGAVEDDVFVLPDERLLQRVGIRFVFHDQYYQTSAFQPAPLWSNKVVSGPVALTPGVASYTFDRPAILSARDTLRVVVALEAATDANTFRRASVSFYGTGVQSKRPYFLGSARNLSTVAQQVVQGADFRNDGTEPIALTDMTVELSAQDDDPVGAGDVRLLRVQVRQLGNGIGADWFIGPQTPLPIGQCFAGLLGFTQGRAVVHQFPGEGLLWEPGEGVRVEGSALAAESEGLNLIVGLSGYISLV
jgi:hypothetical protein